MINKILYAVFLVYITIFSLIFYEYYSTVEWCCNNIGGDYDFVQGCVIKGENR